MGALERKILNIEYNIESRGFIPSELRKSAQHFTAAPQWLWISEHVSGAER